MHDLKPLRWEVVGWGGAVTASPPRRRWSVVIAWYDLWVGLFWDRERRRLYVLPLPCLGIVIQF
jgi:hypothetical protein